MKEVSVMRLFEILTLIALSLSLLSLFVPRGKRPRWMAFLPSLAVLLVLAQHLRRKPAELVRSPVPD